MSAIQPNPPSLKEKLIKSYVSAYLNGTPYAVCLKAQPPQCTNDTESEKCKKKFLRSVWHFGKIMIAGAE